MMEGDQQKFTFTNSVRTLDATKSDPERLMIERDDARELKEYMLSAGPLDDDDEDNDDA